MSSKPIFDLDGTHFSTLEGFYEEVSRVLLSGAKWGHNLDAFNDILRGGFGTPEGGFILRWSNSNVSRERLGYAETVRQLEKRLLRCHRSAHNSVSKDLDLAKQRLGPTVFDWLVEIARKHTSGGEEEDSGVELLLA